MPPTCAPSTRATSSTRASWLWLPANGAEESIWGGRLTFTGYDSDTVEHQDRDGLGATATFEVQVEDLVTEQYTGS